MNGALYMCHIADMKLSVVTVFPLVSVHCEVLSAINIHPCSL